MTRASTAWRFAYVIALAIFGSLASPVVAQAPPPGPQKPIPGGPVILLPDLWVTAGLKPPKRVNGACQFDMIAGIHNKGPGVAVLPFGFNKPMVTAYPSIPLPGFVQPYQSLEEKVVLKPGQSVVLYFAAVFAVPSDGESYQVFIRVDPSNLVKELNENNNTTKFNVVPGSC